MPRPLGKSASASRSSAKKGPSTSSSSSSPSSTSFRSRFQVFRQRTKLSLGPTNELHLGEVDDATAEFFSFRTEDDDATESSYSSSSSSSPDTTPRSILKTKHSILKEMERDGNGSDSQDLEVLEHQRRSQRAAEKKSVRFSHVRQSYHTSILGDHPSPEHGPPLTLSWKAFHHETIPFHPIDNNDSHQQHHHNRSSSLRQSSPAVPPSLDLMSALQAEEERNHRIPRRWSAEERVAICARNSDQNKKHAQRAAMARVQRESRRIRHSREQEWVRFVVWQEQQQQQQQQRRQQCERDPRTELDERLDLLLM